MWYDDVIADWGRRIGVDVAGARLLRVGHTAAFALPGAGWFLRVHDVGDDPEGDATFARAAGSGFLQPALAEGRHVWTFGRHAVSVWPLADQHAGDASFDWHWLGSTLASLARRPIPSGVRRLPSILDVAGRRLADYRALPSTDLRLAELFAQRLERIGGAPRAPQREALVHADAHPGNTIMFDGQLTVCDYDCTGTGEVVESAIGVAVMYRHYGIGTDAWQAFCEGWGEDPASHPDFERLVGIRELLYASTCFAHGAVGHEELTKRIAALGTGGGGPAWSPVRVPR
jgi:hypothetical protein